MAWRLRVLRCRGLVPPRRAWLAARGSGRSPELRTDHPSGASVARVPVLQPFVSAPAAKAARKGDRARFDGRTSAEVARRLLCDGVSRRVAGLAREGPCALHFQRSYPRLIGLRRADPDQGFLKSKGRLGRGRPTRERENYDCSASHSSRTQAHRRGAIAIVCDRGWALVLRILPAQCLSSARLRVFLWEFLWSGT